MKQNLDFWADAVIGYSLKVVAFEVWVSVLHILERSVPGHSGLFLKRVSQARRAVSSTAFAQRTYFPWLPGLSTVAVLGTGILPNMKLMQREILLCNFPVGWLRVSQVVLVWRASSYPSLFLPFLSISYIGCWKLIVPTPTPSPFVFCRHLPPKTSLAILTLHDHCFLEGREPTQVPMHICSL